MVLWALLCLTVSVPIPETTSSNQLVLQTTTESIVFPDECHAVSGMADKEWNWDTVVNTQRGLIDPSAPQRQGFNRQWNNYKCCNSEIAAVSNQDCLNQCIMRAKEETSLVDVFEGGARMALSPYLYQIFNDANRRSGLCTAYNVITNLNHHFPGGVFPLKTKLERLMVEAAGMNPATDSMQDEHINAAVRYRLINAPSAVEQVVKEFGFHMRAVSMAMDASSDPKAVLWPLPKQPISTVQPSSAIQKTQRQVDREIFLEEQNSQIAFKNAQSQYEGYLKKWEKQQHRGRYERVS